MGKNKLDATEAGARIIAMLGIALPLLRLVTILDIGQVSFVTYALLSPLPLHLQMLWGTKRWREAGEIILVATVFATAYFYGGTFHRSFNAWSVVAASMGMASLLVNGAHMLWAYERKRLPYFMPSVWILLATLVVPIGLSLLSEIRPEPAYDAWLFAFDGRLGFQPSFVLGRLFLAWPALASVCSVIYLGLPVLIIIFYGAQLYNNRLRYTNIIGTSIVGGILGGLLIKILPAAGPIYAFHTSFPYQAPSVIPGFIHTIMLSEPLNSIPSMHSMWAFLMFWGARKCGIYVRGFAAVVLVGTLLATVGFGEHYLIDLVVGLPLAVAVDVACIWGWRWFSWQRGRLVVAMALAITIAWLILLKAQVLLNLPIFACWILLVSTVAVSLYLRASVTAEADRKAEERGMDGLDPLPAPQYRPVVSA